ncbi:MAG: DUF4145 domain-containing protein, partial [Polyangiaceae bacterium]
MQPATALMKSQNFEFLRPKHPELADLGGFAEAYARPDPAGALVKLRRLIEDIVSNIYESYRLPRPYDASLLDLLTETSFRSAVPEVVQAKFHAIRKAGNRAAHREPPSAQVALASLRDGFDVGQWFFLRIDGGNRAQCPTYQEPASAPDSAALQKENKKAIEQLALQEDRLQKVLADLDEERKKREAAEIRIKQSDAEYAALRAEGEKAANVLHLNEEATRYRLIDEALLDAGWKVGPRGKDTDQVRQEVKVFEHPTPSGEGFADYVLYGDDGKPLAVVEAKKTAKSAQLGAEQARIYATCIEKETG